MSFFGHRQISNPFTIEAQLEKLIRELLTAKEYVEFLVGRDLNALFPVHMMDSCEEMMIQDWYGALYQKEDIAYLCWTYDPEVTYVLEYTPSKMPDSEIIKMAESAAPIDQE